jgi:hypothetical protein
MVLVNGKKFKIYELDNIDSFKSRVASSKNTIETFLHFTKDVTDTELRNKKNNIIVNDILAEVKESANKNGSIIQLLKDIQYKVGKNKYKKGNEIVKIWLAYNKKLQKDVKIQGKLPLNTIGDLLEENNFYITSRQIHTDWSRINDVLKDYEGHINFNKQNVNDTLVVFNEFDNIDESAASTDFEIDHIQFALTLDIKDISLLEIFNTIKLNQFVPFATTMDFYKISHGFIPPEEWAYSSEESLILQVSQKKFISTSSNISNYESAIVRVDPDSKYMKVDITINTNKDNVQRDEFTKRSISVFDKLNVNIKQVDESKVVGVFYFPILRLDKYVFADLVMNDPIFSRLITIDDHDKATKMKPGIYIHVDHPSTGYITATLTEKIMIKGDPTMKTVDPDYFEIGGSFIRVKISRANNIKSVNIFKEILGKLFVLYDEKKDSIIEYYKNYIPDFGDVPPPQEKEETRSFKLSDVAPDLYVTGYTRNCKPDRMPIMISEEKAIKAQSEGNSVLKFPRDIPDDPDAFKFPMDGEGQNYYICEKPGYKYVGIKNNKLKNADMYPYVPCCFGMDQTKKPKYLNYYEGKELIVGENKQNNIIRTDKILKYNQFGSLPPNLENLFTIIDPNPKYEYVRKGVYKTQNSFINVVMEALNDETYIQDIDGEKEIGEELTNVRLSLAKKNIVPLCRQELYDKNVKEIIKLIKDPKVYFDPKLFIHLLEDKFDCNIFIFTRKILDGEMVLPRHLQAYYKNRTQQRCIYVYEHMGSESDHSKYPQCELIIKYDTKKSRDNVQFSFTHKEAINIRNVYSRLRNAYALNTTINETYMPIDPSINIKSQWIDSYGKTRRINILYENKDISLVISPIQPIKSPETIDTTIYLTDISTAMKLVDTLNIQITSQTVIQDTTKEINGTLGNVNISIPVNYDSIIDGIQEKQYGLSYPEKEDSSLEKYNRNKKMARYLVEYTIWIYSNFLNDNGIVDINDDNISQFAKNFFEIKPDYDYGYIEKTLKKDSLILDSGKIVVHNEETIKRLVYVLRLSAQRNIDSIFRYHERVDIRNYYVDITDFDNNTNQVILFGEESVNKWILENNTTYTIKDEVQIGSNTPYFFKNINIDNNVYLAQNIQTLDKASDIAVTWIREGNNIGIYSNNVPVIAFTLYSYINSNNISKGRQIKGKPFSTEIKILGYKIDNKAEYTVLLPLS